LVYYGFNEHDFVRAFVINSRKVKYLYPHIAVVVSCCSDSDGVSVFDHRVTLRMIEDLTRRHFIPRSSAKPRRQTVVFFPTSAPVEPKAWSFAAQCLAAMGLWLRQTNVAETALTVVGAELLITTHSEEDLDAEAKAEISSWNRGDPTDMLWLSHEHVEIPLTVQEALGQLPENVTLSVLTREEWLQSNQWKNVLADDEVNQWCSTVQLD
jgi:hypothetical protein